MIQHTIQNHKSCRFLRHSPISLKKRLEPSKVIFLWLTNPEIYIHSQKFSEQIIKQEALFLAILNHPDSYYKCKHGRQKS